jgi:hypothetical protein
VQTNRKLVRAPDKDAMLCPALHSCPMSDEVILPSVSIK